MRIPDSHLPLPFAPTSMGKTDVKPTLVSAKSNLVASASTPVKSDGFEKRALSGNTGITPPALPDASSLVALWGLDQAQGPITGDQMAAAVEAGVGDLDGKAASEEFQMFSDWAQRNESRLSPEAKQVMDVYKKYADAAHLLGQGGLPQTAFKNMVQEMKNIQDVSAKTALAGLDKAEGPITGDQMADAISKGISDADGKGASDEYKQFSDWAQKNESRLSPEAKEVFGIYKKHAEAAQAKGQSGLPDSDFKKMVKEMDGVQDVSAKTALAGLDKAQGPINGDQMAAAIRKGISDADGKGASDEYKQFADWAQKNEKRLSPEAKEVLGIYEKHAKAAQAHGQSGISDKDYRQMVKEMNGVRDASATKALADLSHVRGHVSGRQMLNAIRKGVGDFDGKSATDEFKQFADWAKTHSNKLSPEAKKVLATYEKYAKAAQAHGDSGIALNDYRKMLREMTHELQPRPMHLMARTFVA
ncbi:hypothetical protein [Hyalangium versicolor]|uniref:hypothetical protein n=1 Tax=Hyalangium versicolor TaxID=2861190 RepID=UPI001CCB0AF8|nr:hypothetical protein [Hyalangium versicolor]